MPDTDFANPATVDGQPQNLTGDIIPPGGTDSALPFARSGSNFLADSGYDPAKSEGVQHDLAGVAEKARDAGSFADRQAATRADKYQSDMESAYALERSSADDPALKPWNAEEERSKMVRGPIEQFGSIGTIFAMAASAFTRRPMVSALNAGAAAMNAMKQSDEKAYNSAFEAWKDNSQLAIKRFNMEREMFEDVNKLSTSNMAEWRMKRAAIAAQFEDTKTLALLDAGMDPTVLKLDAERVTTFGKMQENQKAMFQMKAEQDLYNSYIQAHTPEGKKLQEMPPLEQLKVKAGALQAVMESRRVPLSRGLSPDQEFMQRFMSENPNATAKEMGDAYDEFKRGQKTPGGAGSGGSPRTLAAEKVDVIEKAKAEFRAAHDGREPNAEESKDLIAKATTGSDKPTLSDETATYMAKQYMQGDKSVLQNLGRGVQGQANLIYLREKVVDLAKKEGVSPAELATRMAEFSGMLAAQRTLGQRTANVELFNNEAVNMMDVAQQKSRDVPRTQFPSVNKALLAYERQTGDPNVRAFGAAINTVINTYAKAISGGAAGTVSDKEHAREILQDADTPEQFDAVINILKQELQAARTAPGQVRQELRNLSGGGSTLESGKVPPEPVKMPPANLLKEGVLTTFSNGSKWTLQGGKPAQVGP